MRKRRIRLIVLAALAVVAVFALQALPAQGAYHHMGEIDSDHFLSVYPETAGTKLDSCTLCHSGGSYVNNKGATVTLGSCQWCHYTYGYDASGEILDTLNAYGLDYLDAGRDTHAVAAIADDDSDGDGYRNVDEIAAIRFPGDAADDPTKVMAPYRVYTLAEIEAMPAHTQFQLMNTHKSGDYYAEFTGVTMESLLADAGMQSSATGIQVYAPDGFATYHPLEPTTGFYHVLGDYPASTYHYDVEADRALTAYGWCDYSADSCAGRVNGEAIPDIQKMILAYRIEGRYLTTGVLNAANKLDGDGPFRVVPPQRIPGPPDQASTSSIQDVIWPFDGSELYTDHSAGFSTRSATIVKVEPMADSLTDIDTLEAGWEYVDEGKIVVYGAIDPVPTACEKLEELGAYVGALDPSSMAKKQRASVLAAKLAVVRMQLANGATDGAMSKLLYDVLPKADGFALHGAVDTTDWVISENEQRHVYWALQEILTLLGTAE